MEEKDINGIAAAVSAAIGKLNSDTKEKEVDIDAAERVFNCPDCGTSVKARTTYCPNCGCPLEWED